MTTPTHSTGAEMPDAQQLHPINAAVTDFVLSYELDSGEGIYQPTEHERFLLEDAILTILDDEDFKAALQVPGAIDAAPAPVEQPAQQPEGLREALQGMVDQYDRDTCTHEETHRGGAIWTICDGCGRKWADDEGGFKPYSDPPKVARARAALAATPVREADGYPEPPEAFDHVSAVTKDGADYVVPVYSVEQLFAFYDLGRAVREAAEQPAGEYPAMPDAVAYSLGLAKYAHSSNIFAAHEFTPDTEHADEWEELHTADQLREYADATVALRASRPLPPSAYVNAASIRGDDKPATVVRKLDSAFHDAVTFPRAEAEAALASQGQEALHAAPLGYITGFDWKDKQSEQLVKITRRQQSQYGFNTAIYTAPHPAPAADSAPIKESPHGE